MNSTFYKLKSISSSINVLGKTVIVLLLAGLVFGIVSIASSDSKETKNAVATDSALPVTEGDLPVVKADDDKTGEILPPADTSQQPPADITRDDLGFPPQ